MQLPDALRALLEACEPPGVERIPVAAAAGRVAAGDVVARVDVPAHPRAVADGYLVRPEDCRDAGAENPVRLEVVHPVYGRADGEGQPRPRKGRAWRVEAGAPVPDAGLAVLPAHAVERDDGFIRVTRPPTPGLNILAPGGNISRNTVILGAGELITAPAVGAMTAAGILELDVFRRPRVMLAAVGRADEPAAEGQPAGTLAGDGNLAMLTAAVTQTGCDVVGVRCLPPDADVLSDLFRRAVEQGVDVVLTAGGIAPAAAGPVADAWTAAGGRFVVSGLDCRPGRSFHAGLVMDTWLFALSPAPSSSLAVFMVLARPFLLRLAGRQRITMPVVRARLARGHPGEAPQARLIWARLHGAGPFTAEPAADATRGRMLYPMNADALLIVPPGAGPLSAHQYVWAMRLDAGAAEGQGDQLLPLQPARPRVLGVGGPAGRSRSAFVERMIHEIGGLGLQVAVIRPAPHGFSWAAEGDEPDAADREGTRDRGAGWVALVGPQASLLYEATDLPGSAEEDRLGRLLDRLTTSRHVPDVVIVEGFSASDLPKVWVGPPRPDVEPRNVLAVVQTRRGALRLPGVPVFMAEHVGAVVEHVLARTGGGGDDDDADVA